MKDVNEVSRIRLTDIDGVMGNYANMVMIEVTDFHDFIGKDKQLIFSDLAKKISEYESAPAWGQVIKVPERLFFHRKSSCSMEWETKQELKEGDKVWFQRSMYLNAPRIIYDNKEYVLIRYADIYMRERAGEKHMINGFLLVSPEIDKKKCVEYTVESSSLTKCRVVLVSDPVNYHSGIDDNIKVESGDLLILSDAYRVTLEDKLFSELNETYYVIQRREIAYIYDN